ncbi:hypothetical protein OQA88_5781 [Cercophora sp. LCS_1]
MASQLAPLLPSSLLHLALTTLIPYPPSQPLDFSLIRRTFFHGSTSSFPPTLITQSWALLRTLHTLGLDNIPALLSFLPSPSSADFPLLALGMQLLLDQMPRRLLKGLNQRWTNAYFDSISLRLAKSLLSLPDTDKPRSWSRWKDTVSLDYWILVRAWFGTPFVHSDSPESQSLAAEFTNETRLVVEQITGTVDPYRQQRDVLLKDIYAFPRVIRADPKPEEETKEGFAYWMCMLMDVHKPIVDAFGHYPYRNVFFGREDTEEEMEWFRRTGDFGRPKEEVRKLLGEDVKEGRLRGLEVPGVLEIGE